MKHITICFQFCSWIMLVQCKPELIISAIYKDLQMFLTIDGSHQCHVLSAVKFPILTSFWIGGPGWHASPGHMASSSLRSEAASVSKAPNTIQCLAYRRNQFGYLHRWGQVSSCFPFCPICRLPGFVPVMWSFLTHAFSFEFPSLWLFFIDPNLHSPNLILTCHLKQFHSLK